ncbi:hypothetical protein [Clostridium sp.]|uniref:hypothetical protein n=1 Tax=Clostridium sp. TaxID=1506 RepID=UPI0026222FF1|nr:hypothetical protein [Clostridium sp.]
MIIYRPHRRDLADAMAEAKEFDTVEEMKEYIVKQWRNQFDISDVVLGNETIDDDRIGWKDTKYVCIKRLGKEDYMKKYKSPQCVGMCATNYQK